MKITKVEGAVKPLEIGEVTMREPLVEDLIMAERIAGKVEGVAFTSALLSQIVTFDGEELPPEEIRRLSSKDFLILSAELDSLGVATSPSE